MSTQPTDRVTLELHPNDLENLKKVLEFGMNWLPRSQAPAIDVTNVVAVSQQILPLLTPIADNKVEEKKTEPLTNN